RHAGKACAEGASRRIEGRAPRTRQRHRCAPGKNQWGRTAAGAFEEAQAGAQGPNPMDRGPADARHHRLTALMTGAALGLMPALACAEAPAADRARADQEGVFSLVVENDSLSSGADRNYTSGVEFSYTSPNNARIPAWLDNAATPFTQFFSN